MRMERARWRETTCTVQTPFCEFLSQCVCAMSVRHAGNMCVRQQSVCTHGSWPHPRGVVIERPMWVKCATSPTACTGASPSLSSLLFGGETWRASVEARSPTVNPQRGSGRTSEAAEEEDVGAERAATCRFSFVALSTASIFSCSFLFPFSCSSCLFSS